MLTLKGYFSDLVMPLTNSYITALNQGYPQAMSKPAPPMAAGPRAMVSLVAVIIASLLYAGRCLRTLAALLRPGRWRAAS